MTNRTHLLAASASVFALLATTPAAFAQSPDDVIIVSATKRDTTLQETPVAVTVTSADVIEKAQILDIKDLQSVVPTFRVSQLQNSANTSLIIRGFGNGGNNIGIEPAVGVFVDGVYRSRAAAQIGDLPKLERVEVLSGPQSTLFGKNASAGVVSVITAAPEFETSGYIEGGVGNYNQVYGKAYLTGAVSDDVAISLGIGFQNRDGYYENLAEAQDFNDIERFNLRGQALWEPSDTTSFRLILDRSTIDENCCGTGVIEDGPFAAGQPDVRNIVLALGGNQPSSDNQFAYETYGNKNSQNEIEDQGVSLESKISFGNLDVTSITAYRENQSDYGSDSDYNSLEILENVFQETNIRTFTQELRLDTSIGDNVDLLVGGYYFNEDINQDAGIDYGADTRTYVDLLAGSPAILSTLELTNGFAPGTFFSDDVRVLETFTQDDEAFSIFGQVDFKPIDRLTATLGLNYTKDKKQVSIDSTNTDAFGNLDFATANGFNFLAQGSVQGAFDNPDDPVAIAFANAFFGLPLTAANFTNIDAIVSGAIGVSGAGNGSQAAFLAGVEQSIRTSDGLLGLQFQPQQLEFPNSVEDGRSNDDELTYTARLAYEVNDNFNVYGSYATGFKASSWNLTRDTRPFFTDAAALDAAGLLPNNYDPSTGRNFGTRFADPEKAEVFEIGLKARFDWGAFNIAAFDQTIENFQSTIFQGTGFVLSNAGSQSTKGIEFDSTFNPTDSLRVTFAGVVLDPVYDDFVGAPGFANVLDAPATQDLTGEKPAGVSELSLSTSATYTHDLGNGMEGFIRGDYQYESEVQIVDNIEGVNRSTNILNGSVGVSLDNGVSVQVWGRNLNGDEHYTSAFPGVIQGTTVNGYPNQPRTYGASARYKF